MLSSPRFRRLLVVIKQTAYEEYSQLKLRGKSPNALRWKRLESRYKTHKQCVNDLMVELKKHNVEFTCINRVEMDRQHLADVDLVISVGGDGTVLSSAHFLDHGTIPLLGINSDPISAEDVQDESVKKNVDERRSHGALCALTSHNMIDYIPKVLYGDCKARTRSRIQCIVKSTFTETRLVPALNDLLVCNPSPAAVSRFRMGKLQPVIAPNLPLRSDAAASSSSAVEDGGRENNNDNRGGSSSGHDNHYLFSSFHETGLRGAVAKHDASQHYGTVTRFGGVPFDVRDSLNVWSSGMWVSTAAGSTAAMAAAGGQVMNDEDNRLQYIIREHMFESSAGEDVRAMNNGLIEEHEQLHVRWNSNRGGIYVDGPHITHPLELGDEILLNNQAPPFQLFMKCDIQNTN